MTSLELKIYGDKVLRYKAEEVDDFGDELSRFLDEMVETMIVEDGVGLAAPQVGVSKRIAVLNPEPANERTLIKLINPRIISTSEETDTVEEGCLSIPGVRGQVVRPSAVEIAYLDEDGNENTIEVGGLMARIIQHELDHLNGVLFIDRLSLAKRMIIKSKLRALKNRSGRG
jgi:peptide deformylase